MKILADIAANILAVIHLAYFAFVVGGMIAIIFGPRRDISWIRKPWFRIGHIAAIYVVLVEDVTGFPCPLNVLQWQARATASGATETTVGVGGVLDYLLYHTISPLALDVIYWSFGVLVVALLWMVPPRWRAAPAIASTATSEIHSLLACRQTSGSSFPWGQLSRCRSASGLPLRKHEMFSRCTDLP